MLVASQKPVFLRPESGAQARFVSGHDAKNAVPASDRSPAERTAKNDHRSTVIKRL
jgi:hypothetical protein